MGSVDGRNLESAKWYVLYLNRVFTLSLTAKLISVAYQIQTMLRVFQLGYALPIEILSRSIFPPCNLDTVTPNHKYLFTTSPLDLLSFLAPLERIQWRHWKRRFSTHSTRGLPLHNLPNNTPFTSLIAIHILLLMRINRRHFILPWCWSVDHTLSYIHLLWVVSHWNLLRMQPSTHLLRVRPHWRRWNVTHLIRLVGNCWPGFPVRLRLMPWCQDAD